MVGSDPAPGSELVYEALVEAGIDLLVEVPGHQTIPLDRHLHERDGIRRIVARHETAIPHVAWGHYEAGGSPAATMSVPGPGDTNAMHGLRNAYDDRVPVVHLSADVDPDHRGRNAIHELEPETLDTVVKRNEVVTNTNSLPRSLAAGLGEALTRPAGPVRFSIPASYLGEEIDGGGVEVTPERTTHDPQEAYDRAAALLEDAERPVVYVDNGARRSPGGTEAVRELVEEFDVPVVAGYKGFGVVPTDDPRYTSTPGLALIPGTRRVLERADVVLGLGAYFDGPSTSMWTLPMGERLIHVTAEPNRIGASYEADVPVVADVADACRALLDRVDGPIGWDGARIGREVRAEYEARLESSGLLEDRSPAPSPAVFRALRETIPDDAVIVADVGHFRTWALNTFDVYEPEGIVTPGSWTGMGVGVPAAIGATIARPDRPVVAFTGDGCLMMCLQELHTAAEYDLDLTVVVFDNADYAIISREESLREFGGDRFFAWDSPDFPALAEAFGCNGRCATSPGEAAEAVAAAVESDGPELVNVVIDPEEISPGEVADYESEVDLA